MKLRRHQRGFIGLPGALGSAKPAGGAGVPTFTSTNAKLLIHGDVRPWLDQSPGKRQVCNYQGRATLAGGRISLSDTQAGLYVFNSTDYRFGTGSWFLSASVNANYTSTSARIFDTRPTTASADGWQMGVDTSRRPFMVIEGTTYGTGTPAANLLLTNDTTQSLSFSYDGTVLRCFVDGVLSWSHTVTLNIDTGIQLAIGNSNPAATTNSPASSLADLLIVSGESVATASFTVPAAWDAGAGDTLAGWNPATYSNVKLNLHGSSLSNGSTTFTDTAASPHTLTANGNVQASTAQFRIGSSSILFDGSSDYISTPDSADWDFGTGDYSIEAQIRTANSAGRVVASNYQNSSTGWTCQNNVSAGRFILNETGDGADLDSGISVATVDVWSHLLFARVGGWLQLFVEGELQFFVASSQNITGSTSSLLIGALPGFTGSTGFNGYLQEIRMVKGEGPPRSFAVQSAAHPDS
jgi:hypothetical protein